MSEKILDLKEDIRRYEMQKELIRRFKEKMRFTFPDN